MTLTNWLLSLTALLLGVSNFAILYILNETTAKWMRLFSSHLGVPIPSMEGRPLDEKKTELKQDTRKRLSIPVPMGGMR